MIVDIDMEIYHTNLYLVSVDIQSKEFFFWKAKLV